MRAEWAMHIGQILRPPSLWLSYTTFFMIFGITFFTIQYYHLLTWGGCSQSEPDNTDQFHLQVELIDIRPTTNYRSLDTAAYASYQHVTNASWGFIVISFLSNSTGLRGQK